MKQIIFVLFVTFGQLFLAGCKKDTPPPRNYLKEMNEEILTRELKYARKDLESIEKDLEYCKSSLEFEEGISEAYKGLTEIYKSLYQRTCTEGTGKWCVDE